MRNPIVEELGKIFEKAGKKLFLVGGTVRDAFLGRYHEDLDFTTDAVPDEMVKIIGGWADALWLVGVEFGTVGLQKGHLKIEITTFRTEIYKAASRHPAVSFATDIQADLSRRDFTINAMAVDVATGEIIDPFGGEKDLERGVLHTPIEPEASFTDDPLRMLRAVRFVSTLGVTVAPEVKEAMINLHHSLSYVSNERIRDEVSKMLMGENVTEAIRLLIETELHEDSIPEIDLLRVVQDPDFHHKDVFEHTLMVIRNIRPDLTLRLAALFHDVAKGQTRRVQEGKVVFYNHDILGSKMAKKRLRELRFPKAVIDDVSELILMHMRAYTYRMGWLDSAVRRFARDAGPLLPGLIALIRADCTSKNAKKVREAFAILDELEERIAELEAKEESAKIRPPVDGHEVMEHLGVPPGPIVGKALEMLLEAKLEGEIETKEEAYRLLDEWIAEQGTAE
ncbi:MAG: CCA tRNA nucleotidyltransferase [Candidatus Aquicultorales bacterium]